MSVVTPTGTDQLMALPSLVSNQQHDVNSATSADSVFSRSYVAAVVDNPVVNTGKVCGPKWENMEERTCDQRDVRGTCKYKGGGAVKSVRSEGLRVISTGTVPLFREKNEKYS